MSEALKKIIEKANQYDDLLIRTKGYGYDSLCLRYQIARDAQARLEYELNRLTGRKEKDLDTFMNRAQRDELKFYQIVDDLIGPHD